MRDDVLSLRSGSSCGVQRKSWCKRQQGQDSAGTGLEKECGYIRPPALPLVTV